MSKQQKRVMGRGLSALLNDDLKKVKSATDDNAKEVVGNILELNINEIIPNAEQPRTNFEENKLQELAQSIKELGIIQPITVRKNDNGKYDLISGERRYRASKIAGLQTIPAFIRLVNDNELLEMALVENIQREDLDAIEIALSYEKLINEIQLTQENLSKRVGKERSTITNYLRLLKLHPNIQNAIRDGKISMGHGKALTSLDDEEQQLLAFETIVAQELSVRKTESFIQSLKKSKKTSVKKEIILPNHIKKGLKKFEDFFEIPVEIKSSKKGNEGKIILSFSTLEEFEKIQELLS